MKRLREAGRDLLAQASRSGLRDLIACVNSGQLKKRDFIAQLPGRVAVRPFCEAIYDTVHEELRIAACSPRFQILRSSQEQEDAIQGALIRTFETALRVCLLGRVRWEESDETLEHFFRKIASRELRKERRKISGRLRRLRGTTTRLEETLAVPNQIAPSLDDERAEVEEILQVLVGDDIDRTIIRMRLDARSYEAISEELWQRGFPDFTANALSQRYTRAKKELEAKLARGED